MSRRAELILKAAAVIVLILLVRKAFVDTDVIDYDSLAYHLPFAARLWHITTPSQFVFTDELEMRYRGFPLLGEGLQGFFWVAFDHMQAANLAALGSLLLYCWYARIALGVPWFLTFLALLAVPMVQVHAVGSLVDLPANLATAVALLTAFRFCAGGALPAWKDIGTLVVAAAISVNTKFLQIGVILVALALVAARLTYLTRRTDGGARRTAVRMLLVLVLATPVIFATPFRNAVFFGNPVYPTYAPSAMPDYLRGAPRSARWVLSIFEYRAFDFRRPYLWTGEQGHVPAGAPADRMGGYFAAYVILNLVTLGFIAWRSASLEARLGWVFFLLLSVITSLHPQSHELRFYMYWMVVLVTLNLYLLARAPTERPMLITLQRFGIMCGITLLVVIGLTRGAYVWPWTQPEVTAYTRAIEPAIRSAVERNSAFCVVGTTNRTFLYADTFHFPMRYSVKAAMIGAECDFGPVVAAQ